MALSFALISLAAVAPGVAAATQNFAINDDNTLTVGTAGSAPVTISNGATEYFVATLAAAVAVDFGAGTWVIDDGTLGTSSGAQGATWVVGFVTDPNNPGSTFTAFGGTPAPISSGTGAEDFAATNGAMPINAFLTLQITDLSQMFVDSQPTVIGSGTTAVATLQSPAGDPGYPTPSIATIVLLALGLVMVAGVVYVRTRQ